MGCGRALLFLCASAVVLGGCSGDRESTEVDFATDTAFGPAKARARWERRIPHLEDWTDHGEIFGVGAEGEWDRILWGGFAASAVVSNGRFLLYYQGSKTYDEEEGTVAHRSIGVATSGDGIEFTKSGASPVLTWSPSGDLEEGAASGGACVGPDDYVYFFYGANTSTSPGLVSADGRLATSSDGLSFTDHGIILDHRDSRVWGAGDEIFPVAGFWAGTDWHCFYIPNGTPQTGDLGVAWGPSPTDLTDTAQVLADGSPVSAWGPAGWARISRSIVAIFVSVRSDEHADGEHVDVYGVDVERPAVFVGPVRTYVFENATKATVLRDEESGRWYLYYRSRDGAAYGVRTAPLARDETTEGRDIHPTME